MGWTGQLSWEVISISLMLAGLAGLINNGCPSFPLSFDFKHYRDTGSRQDMSNNIATPMASILSRLQIVYLAASPDFAIRSLELRIRLQIYCANTISRLSFPTIPVLFQTSKTYGDGVPHPH
jgi:hypothetical protein